MDANLSETQLLVRAGIAMGAALLIGLQRKQKASSISGIRTFPLIGLCGVLAALAAPILGPWVVVGGLLAIAAFLVASYCRADSTPGLMTECAGLATYLLAVGAFAASPSLIAVAAEVSVLLLHLKSPLHNFVTSLSADEVRAIVQLALPALVVVPVLPN